MNVTCPSCTTVFRVDPAKVPAGGVRARCSVCRSIFRVAVEGAPAEAPAPAPQAAVPPPAPQPAARPSAPAAAPAPSFAPPTPAPVPVPVRPSAPPPFVASPSAPAPRPAAPPPGGIPMHPMHPIGAPHVRPPFSSRPVSIAAPSTSKPAAPRPSGNPFLSKDPGQKARRLARALVSDIVVYNPEKRLEGLRHGTLKQIFDEEIKKSYEEYAGQVGRDLAESTSHFADALNEILGDGSKIF